MTRTPLPAASRVALERLAHYKALIDADIETFSRRLIDDWEIQYTSYSRDAVATYCDILARGGKRLRGALTMAAYEMAGGTDEQMILKAARIVEMIHAYMLIIDDVCDRSDIRRGGPAAHRLLERYHAERGLHGDSTHFGIAQAINAALAGSELARRELGELPVAAELRLEAMNSLHENLVITVHGQINDIFNEAVRDVTEAQVKSVLTWKTAYYSFLSPLNFGAILAGAGAADREYLLEYSVNAGLSYQITDDILGMFGDEEESGKSAQDDLKEGKVTLLVARALAHANPEQKRYLLAALGNHDLTLAEYHECRRIVQDTGALDYARELAERYAARAAEALDEVPPLWDETGLHFLQGLAAYITHRSA